MSFVPAAVPIVARSASAPPPSRSAFVLHGIFGAGRNWRTWSNRLVERLPAWRLLLVDLRHHGKSLGAPPPNTLPAAAGDLAELARTHGAPEAVLGHSFGGKVGLAFAATRPLGLRQLWILDCPLGEPARSDTRGSDPGRVIAALRGLPPTVARRSDVIAPMVARGVSESVAAWMATNLQPAPEGFAFPYDLNAIVELLEDYWRTDGITLLARCDPTLAIHVVRAERSDRFSTAELVRLDALDAAGRIELHVLKDAGHFLHADNPDGLLDLIAPRLLSATP